METQNVYPHLDVNGRCCDAGHQRWIRWLIRLLAILLWASTLANAVQADEVLILYDSSGPFSHVGVTQAVLLENLLGHFKVDVIKKPVSTYSAGDMDTKLATFYLGTVYDERSYYVEGSPQWHHYNDFLRDAADTTAPMIWFNYNLWQLEDLMQQNGQSMADTMGFTFNGVWDHGYNRVDYKNTELFKGVVPFLNPGAAVEGCIEEGDGRWACATELNVIDIIDSAAATVLATTYSTIDPEVGDKPYVTRSGNFWFVGDIPFSYMSEEDRYLALADILHDMLGIEHEKSHKALVRLEDISAATDSWKFLEVTGYLQRESIPFAVSVIPQYVDGAGRHQYLAHSTMGRILSNLYFQPGSDFCHGCSNWPHSARVSVVAHGATHQSYFHQNPFDGISGNDFEFYRVTLNDDNSLNFVGPLPWDTHDWAFFRMQHAGWELLRSGLRAFAWEAPHYLASANVYSSVKKLYPIHYGRMTYFVDQGQVLVPNLKTEINAKASDSVQMLGQFFPYPIHRDIYGYRLVPENIGYFEPQPFPGYRPLYPEDLIRHGRKNLVVRDGYASFFYHPHLGVPDLKTIVEGLQALGYQFVTPDSIFRHHRNPMN